MNNDNDNEIVPASLVAHSHFPEASGEVPAQPAGEFNRPMRLEPKTLLGFLFLLLSSGGFITRDIDLALEEFKREGKLQKFIETVRVRLVDSLRADLQENEARDVYTLFFKNHIPTIQEFYDKILGQFMRYPNLRHSVNECIRAGNLGNGLVVYLIFLVQSFFQSEKTLSAIQSQNLSSLKLYREISPEDQDVTALVEGYRWMYEKFTIWKIGAPTEGTRYISLEISWENIKNSVILGVFVDDNQVVLAPYGNFIVEEKNETQRIKLRVCPQKRIKNCLQEPDNEENFNEQHKGFEVAPIQVFVEESSSKFLIDPQP